MVDSIEKVRVAFFFIGTAYEEMCLVMDKMLLESQVFGLRTLILQTLLDHYVKLILRDLAWQLFLEI